MYLPIVVLFVMCYVIPDISTEQHLGALSCDVVEDVSYDYRTAVYDICILLYKAVGVRSNLNFVVSPTSIWIMLAAMAEGSEPGTQQKLFNLLHLPNDLCTRQKYYQLATTRAFPSSDVNIRSTRILLIDEQLRLNPIWSDIVAQNALLDIVVAPIKYNPVVTANEIKRIMTARLPRLNLNGNSILLDAMDYNGLWTTAFSDATIQRSPFYNEAGVKIGAVDLMRVKRRARMGYLKSLHAKILELPIGFDGRYKMLFAITIGDYDFRPAIATINKDVIFDVFESLRPSYVQIDVAIPRMVITSEVDVRTILEDLGITELWTDPAVTRNISDPPAFPSSFVQRSTVVLNNDGLTPPSEEQEPPYSLRTGLEPILGRDFIANKPFLFGIFDADTSSCLVAAAYSKPTYT